MIYYRLKPECDNLQRYNGKTVQFNGIWIANELYTEKELSNLVKIGLFVHPKYFEKVEISKKKIYWFFGARFESKGEKNNDANCIF